jgi:DNA helicase HerA-like ATPase
MVTLIFGRSQMGKTSLSKLLIREHSERLIIYDSNNEYKEFGVLTYEDFKKLYERIKRKDFPIRFYTADSDKFFSFLSGVKNFVLCVDELHTYADSTECPKSLKELIRRHAHLGLEFFGAAQRISTVHRSLVSQAHRIITFNQTDFYDLKICEKQGFDPEEVASLKKFKYIIHVN